MNPAGARAMALVCVRVRNLDRDLADVGDRAFALAHQFARVRELESARDLGRAQALPRARGVARELVLDPEFAIATDLARDLAKSIADIRRSYRWIGAPTLVSTLDNALDNTLTLARTINLARNLDDDYDIVRAYDLAGRLDLSPSVALELSRAVDEARTKAGRQLAALEAGLRRRRNRVESEVVAPAAMAARVAHGVVRLLPITSRARYEEEFDSELYELAAAGASWCGQMGYSVRLLDRAWVLRAELREAVTRRVRL